MFVGDSVKNEIEKIIRNFRQALTLRLRFISHINLEEAMTPLAPPMSTWGTVPGVSSVKYLYRTSKGSSSVKKPRDQLI